MNLLLLLALLLPVGPFAGTVTGKKQVSPCVSGSCSFYFSGPSGQPLKTYNGKFVDMSASLPANNYVLTGSSSIQIIALNAQGGSYYNGSTSDTSQITIVAAPTANSDLLKEVCVRGTSNTVLGYCGTLRFSDGGTGWNRACIYKNGSITELVCSAQNSWQINANHTIAIVASGSSTTTLTMFVDGVSIVSVNDSSSPILSGHPGFYGVAGPTLADGIVTNWQDHQ